MRTNNGGVTIRVHKQRHTVGHTPRHPAAPRAPSQSGDPIDIYNDPARGCTQLRPCEITVNDPQHPGRGGVVTIADLKNFRPKPGVDHMQPHGWMVVGLDSNFYSTIGSELEHGELLGKTADVQFTAVTWHWSYGDGSSATRATPGATWAALGVPDFDPTSTSHVYRKKGTYSINLDVTFSAQYRYAGGPWTDVLGTIDVPTNRLSATAGDAKTVLVNNDCTQNPHGPGC